MISFRIDCFDLLAVQGTLKSLLQHHSSKASVLQCPAFLWSNSHIHPWLLEKPQLWLDGPLSAKWCFCFLIWCLGLSWLFFQGAKILISWLQSLSSVILEPKKVKSVTLTIFSQSIFYEVLGLEAVILVFWMLSFKPALSLSSFTFIKGFFNSSLALGLCHLHMWGHWYFSCVSSLWVIQPSISHDILCIEV